MTEVVSPSAKSSDRHDGSRQSVREVIGSMCDQYQPSEELARTMDSVVGAVFTAGFSVGMLSGFVLTVILATLLNWTQIVEIKISHSCAATPARGATIRDGRESPAVRVVDSPVP